MSKEQTLSSTMPRDTRGVRGRVPKGSPPPVISFAESSKALSCSITEYMDRLEDKEVKAAKRYLETVRHNAFYLSERLSKRAKKVLEKDLPYRTVLPFNLSIMFPGLSYLGPQSLLPESMEEAETHLKFILSLGGNSKIRILPTLKDEVQPLSLRLLQTFTQDYNFMGGLGKIYLPNIHTFSHLSAFDYSPDQIIMDAEESIFGMGLDLGYATLVPLPSLLKGHKSTSSVRSSSFFREVQRAWRGNCPLVSFSKPLSTKVRKSLGGIIDLARL